MAGTQQNPKTREIKITKPLKEKEQWHIQYSRFFRYPSLPSSTHPSLRPFASRIRFTSAGKWVSSSSSMATLNLFYDRTARGFVLVVSFQGRVHEEHYISKLIFSWPQMACADDCPFRGSRVEFACYTDSLGQVQKFAMRFSSSSDSQTFINSLKECLKDVGLADNKFGSEMTSPSGIISTNAAYERLDEELTDANPVANCEPVLQPISSHDGLRDTFLDEPSAVHGSKTTCAPLPSSFTALLFDSHTMAGEEPPKAPEAVCLNTHVMDCMAGSPFHDMLKQQETVIHELGGDLSL